MSDPCNQRFHTWIALKIGGSTIGEVVVAELYDAAQSELAAFREELADTKANLIDYQQRLAVAEQRNATLLETAQGLTIQLHAAIGNTEHHEDCIRDLAELQPTESGASE